MPDDASDNEEVKSKIDLREELRKSLNNDDTLCIDQGECSKILMNKKIIQTFPLAFTPFCFARALIKVMD